MEIKDSNNRWSVEGVCVVCLMLVVEERKAWYSPWFWILSLSAASSYLEIDLN